MTDKEKQKHIDAFKYWCETSEECGVVTIPKFVCDNIIKILDNAPTVPNEYMRGYEATEVWSNY